jgi:hypothetical protein
MSVNHVPADMTAWWKCCQCSREVDPELDGDTCADCSHEQCSACHTLFPGPPSRPTRSISFCICYQTKHQYGYDNWSTRCGSCEYDPPKPPPRPPKKGSIVQSQNSGSNFSSSEAHSLHDFKLGKFSLPGDYQLVCPNNSCFLA